MSETNLKKFREKQGLSQWALALKSQVSRNRISLHECDYMKLSDADKLKIVKALKLKSLGQIK